MKCPNCDKETENNEDCSDCKRKVEREARIAEEKTVLEELKALILRKTKEIREFFKNKVSIIEIILSISTIIMMGLIVFMNVQKTNLKEKIIDSQGKYDRLSIQYSSLDKELKSAKDQIQELMQEERQKEINNNIKNLENKVTELTTQKQDLENQINTLSQDVIRIKGQPKTYPAGHLTAGEDLPIGKYKVYGGSSNFVVYSKTGSLRVNIILGNGRYSVSEYIYTFKEGDNIESNSSFKLVEVE